MGFCKNKSCTNAIFRIRQLSERVTDQKLHVFANKEKSFN